MTTGYDSIDISNESGGGVRELIPRGATKAVCVDVIDLGMVPNDFKKSETGAPVMQKRLRIVWETGRIKSNGQRFTISKSYSAKIYDGSNGGNPSALYVHVSSWLGPDWDGRFTSAMVIGRGAELFIEHEKGKQDKTKTFAKVLAVHPLEEGEFRASGSYKRFIPKDDEEAVPF